MGQNGHEPVVKLLLEKNADIESKDDYGQTPLSWAARRGYEPVVKLLLEKNADIESKDNNGQTPLSWAAQNGYEPVVKLIRLAKSSQFST
jgi:ankyrin repeat protein